MTRRSSSTLAALAALMALASPLRAQGSGAASTAVATAAPTGGHVGLNSRLTYLMLEPNQDLRKVSTLLEQRQQGALEAGNLVLGASLIVLGDYQSSNTDSKFGYLMRHPTAANQIGKSVSEAVVHSFQASFTGAVNSWLAGHAELLYDPEQSFGQGTITALTRNQIQLRRGFVLVGDLQRFPVYFAIGKMDAPFGQTGSVSPFTNSTMWHAFGGLGFGAQVGVKKGGLDASAMAVQGGAQFRALNTPVGDGTAVPSKLNNFAGDLRYTLKLGQDATLMAGGSYLRGSVYCQGFPVTHFDACDARNPAWSAYGRFSYRDRLRVEASYAKTKDVWPGTHNPNPPLDVFAASKVSSLDAGARYVFNPGSPVVLALSGEFSNFRSGPTGAPWERQNQWVLGLSGMLRESSKLFVELVRTEGFVPLNFISGGNLAPGETHSVSDARSHVVLVGAQLTF